MAVEAEFEPLTNEEFQNKLLGDTLENRIYQEYLRDIK